MRAHTHTYTHIHTYIHTQSTSFEEGSARRRDLYLNTQHSQDTDIHVPGGICTRIPRY
jgi:hypothetical protein